MNPKFIKTHADLQTKQQDICDGFLAQVLRKTKKAKDYIEEAKIFEKKLKESDTLENILASPECQKDLASACGFSEKAKAKLNKTVLDDTIKEVIPQICKDAGAESMEEIRKEILFRCLLTKGDTMGGSMRNSIGASAGTRLTKKITERLSHCGKEFKVSESKSGKIQKVVFNNRVLLFDKKSPVIDKNIDVILMENSEGKSIRDLIHDKKKYIACGELKGGIDPAGADEHWKTGGSAIDRIRNAFKKNTPKLFFVGAAIEASMAREILKQLKNGKLNHAANLNKEEQVIDLVDWLLSL